MPSFLSHLTAGAWLAAASLPFISTAACASPFRTRDQNPLLAGLGLPMPMPVRIASNDAWQFAADLNWASSAIFQTSERERLLVDAETREWRMTVGRVFAERWALQLQVPWRYVGAGTLDSFIDSWHDFFGLSEGMRPVLPHDQFRIAYLRDDVLLLDMQSSTEGIGDIAADIGYEWLSGERTAVVTWLSVKLPTGDANKLTGSGAADITFTIAGEHRFGRWSLFGQAAMTRLGDGDILGAQQRSIAWSGLAGVDFNVWRGLDLKMQLDAHSAVFDDTSLDYLGEAAILTVGGSYRFDSGWQVDLGVSEDVFVDASPDVVFVLGVSWER